MGSALDIVEIDAASNTGVDNIRELIERAQFAPVQCRYKAYVIDECHMLSTAAFNALLKTLEEPPDRVVFVLATTDPQRVLPTIISRCQRFDFRRIPLPAMIKHLGYIAQQESIAIDEAAVQLVAQIAQGGLRDAESLLDQLSLRADEITVEAVWDLVGAVPERDLLNLVRAIAADDGTVLIERTRNLMDKGREPLIVLQSLVGFYRDLLIAKSAPARADMVAITPPTWAEMTEFAQKLSVPQLLASQQKLQTAEVQVKNTTQPRLWLEITLTSLLPSALGAAAQIATAGRITASGPDKSVLSVANPPTLSAVSSPPAAPVPSSAPPTSAPLTPTSETTALPPAAPAQPSPPESPLATPVTAAASPTPAHSTPAHSTAADAASSPATAAPNAASAQQPGNEVAFGRLDELWTQILAALAPRGTQMLMTQQGSLLAFDGVSAKVGFRSAQLQKMAQQRVPNLEQAFEAVFQRPIKVLLEVQQPKKEEARESTHTADNKPSSPPSHPHPASPPLSRPAPPLPQTNNNPTNHQPPPTNSPTNNNPTTNYQSPVNQPPSTSTASYDSTSGTSAQASQPKAAGQDSLPSAPSSGASPDQWATNQDQDNIKRFAQFFNGQIVNLDDDEELMGSRQGDHAHKSSDPGPDVPF